VIFTPPPEVLRAGATPDDALMVVRGGRNSLDDVHLDRAVADCWERFGFFAISVFGVPGGDLAVLSKRVAQIRRRAEIRVARCGDLRAAGFGVAATFTNPVHFSVVLPDATRPTFARLRASFSERRSNPGYEPDR
jgi:hypothetical protein